MQHPSDRIAFVEHWLEWEIAQLVHHEREREMFYLTTHSTHFIYVYMASDIWLRTILIVRKETCCRHIGYSYQLTARVLLYAPFHRQDNTYHGLCYTSRGALAGTRNSLVHHEGSIRSPTVSYHGATSRPKHEDKCTTLWQWPSQHSMVHCAESQNRFLVILIPSKNYNLFF